MKHRRALTHPASLTIVTDAFGVLPILVCECHRPADQPQAAHYSRNASDAIEYGRSMARRSGHTLTHVRILTIQHSAADHNTHRTMTSIGA